jgi:hypothetical protein
VTTVGFCPHCAMLNYGMRLIIARRTGRRQHSRHRGQLASCANPGEAPLIVLATSALLACILAAVCIALPAAIPLYIGSTGAVALPRGEGEQA